MQVIIQKPFEINLLRILWRVVSAESLRIMTSKYMDAESKMRCALCGVKTEKVSYWPEAPAYYLHKNFCDDSRFCYDLYGSFLRKDAEHLITPFAMRDIRRLQPIDLLDENDLPSGSGQKILEEGRFTFKMAEDRQLDNPSFYRKALQLKKALEAKVNGLIDTKIKDPKVQEQIRPDIRFTKSLVQMGMVVKTEGKTANGKK